MPTLASEVRAIEAADVLRAMGLGGKPGDVESLPELFFYTNTQKFNSLDTTIFVYSLLDF